MAVRKLSSCYHFRWQLLVRHLYSFLVLFFCGFFLKLGASVSLWVPMVTSDLLSKELSSEWPPSGEGLEKPIGQCVLAGRS